MGIGGIASTHPTRMHTPSLMATEDHFESCTPTTNPPTDMSVGIELVPGQVQNEEIMEIIERANEGLRVYPPELCEDGVSGCYFLKDAYGNPAGIFKPQDEEPFSLNCPKDQEGELKHGVLAGEAAVREVAAYLLDHRHFAGVPATVMVRCTHSAFHSAEERATNTEHSALKSKVGSFQAFVHHDSKSCDWGASMFPIKEVHKIGVLDIRIFNIDRHSGNLLVNQVDGEFTLTPIDHGYSLPNTLDEAWFEWLNWPQAKAKFDDETKVYIANLNVDDDVHMLQKLNIAPEYVKTLKITTMLLKKGIYADLTLFEMGSMMSRTRIEEPSELEQLCTIANEQVPQDCNYVDSESLFFENLSSLIDDAIKRKCK